MYVGDTLTDQCIITDVTTSKQYDLVTTLHSLTNQDGTTVYTAVRGSKFVKGTIVDPDSGRMSHNQVISKVMLLRNLPTSFNLKSTVH